MENYEIIKARPYQVISGEVEIQTAMYPKTREIKFNRIPEKNIVYNIYRLKGNNIPPVEGLDFIDTLPQKDLRSLLEHLLNPTKLPEEIRVIRPNFERDIWSVFLRR